MPYWLRLYLPTAVLLALLLAGYGWLESRREQRLLAENDETRLVRAEQMLSGRFDEMVSDLRFLATTADVIRAAQQQAPGAFDAAAALFLALAAQKPEYDQLRLIDAGGRERVRVDAGPDGPVRRAGADLQNQAGRDYFEGARVLEPGRVFVSRFDLDVEHGQIEVPYKPALRFATPLRPAAAPPMVLVTTVRGDALLRALGRTLDSADTQGMLIDADGYWLYHPDAALRWGFQLPGAASMARVHPAAWAEMRSAQGTVGAPDGLFVYRRVYPFRGTPGLSGNAAHTGLWLAVRSPPTSLAGVGRVLLTSLFPALLLMALAACLALAYLRRQAVRAREDERRTREAAEREAAERQQVREHIYRFTLAIQAARSVEAFAATALSELAPRLGIAVGAFYRLDEDWLRPLAGYGLPDHLMLRQFRLGEGLVGTAVRDRRETLIAELPRDYLHVRSAVGSSAPRCLAIVPLWLRDENLGALELGLTLPLDALQTQLLRQLLPLLSLHLDGYLQRRAHAA